MAKIAKSFKLDKSVIECIDKIKESKEVVGKSSKLTQTEIVEQAVYHYYATLYGEKALADVILSANERL